MKSNGSNGPSPTPSVERSATVRVRRRSGPRWGRCPDWVLTSASVGPVGKTLYAALDLGYGAATTRAALAALVGCSERQVASAFRELLEVGALAHADADDPGGSGFVLRWAVPA